MKQDKKIIFFEEQKEKIELKEFKETLEKKLAARTPEENKYYEELVEQALLDGELEDANLNSYDE